MKKTLTTAALSSVLILGMASAAMAIHTEVPAQTYVAASGASQITIDGALRMRGAIESNSKTQDDSNKAYYDTRVRLGVKAVVAPGATGYLQLETAKASGDTVKWGANDAGASLHSGGTKSVGELNVLQAWINYQPSNWGVKVGHMPLALGNKVFFDHTGSGDDAVVAYINPNDSTHIAGILIKFNEGTSITDSSSDLNGYVALATHKFSDSLSVGANWTYLDGGSATPEAVAAVPAVAIGPGTPALGAVAATTVAELANGMAMSTIGLTVDGKATNALSYSADVEFQFGDFSDNGVTTVDAEGFAVRLTGTMDLGAAKVGLLYGYGSGDDGTDATSQENFINFLTDTAYDVLIAGYRQPIPGAFTGGKNSGLSNLSLYQVNASTNFNCPLTGKDVDMKGSLNYMQLNEGIMSLAGGYTTRDDDNVGTELDLVTTWHLTAGLDYKIEAAYLFVDDAFNTSPTGAGSNPDDLFFLRHRLELKF